MCCSLVFCNLYFTFLWCVYSPPRPHSPDQDEGQITFDVEMPSERDCQVRAVHSIWIYNNLQSSLSYYLSVIVLLFNKHTLLSAIYQTCWSFLISFSQKMIVWRRTKKMISSWIKGRAGWQTGPVDQRTFPQSKNLHPNNNLCVCS